MTYRAPLGQQIPTMAEIIPEGERPLAAISHFRVTKEDLMMLAMSGEPFAHTDPNRLYTRLLTRQHLEAGWRLTMSDTHMERATNWEVLHQARGHVLVAGLGIGMIVVPMLRNPQVKSLTVIESNPDVVALVQPHLPDPQQKLTVIGSDIFTWRPARGRRFDVIYFDIWTERNGDNLPQIARLHHAFKNYKAPGGWMDSWYAKLLRADRRRYG